MTRRLNGLTVYFMSLCQLKNASILTLNWILPLYQQDYEWQSNPSGETIKGTWAVWDQNGTRSSLNQC